MIILRNKEFARRDEVGLYPDEIEEFREYRSKLAENVRKQKNAPLPRRRGSSFNRLSDWHPSHPGSYSSYNTLFGYGPKGDIVTVGNTIFEDEIKDHKLSRNDYKLARENLVKETTEDSMRAAKRLSGDAKKAIIKKRSLGRKIKTLFKGVPKRI